MQADNAGDLILARCNASAHTQLQSHKHQVTLPATSPTLAHTPYTHQPHTKPLVTIGAADRFPPVSGEPPPAQAESWSLGGQGKAEHCLRVGPLLGTEQP